ncbi:hypothetical protein DH2020_030474 [Rehmannia glutinosa]|uniref:Apyrase 7 n=1 Tax=Rehmannia glutinosa TaxID=99300 RepID=A0ABR0VNV5_REHGL
MGFELSSGRLQGIRVSAGWGSVERARNNHSNSPPKASPLSYKSPGLPPISGSPHLYPFSSPEKKGNLRHSSSLQDLSTYRRLDLEEGDLSGGVERTSGHAFPPYFLPKENGVSSFSKEKVSPGISSRRKKCVQVICILLCLFLFACLSFALQFLYSNWSRGASKFYVVLDCGSTGTRVYVYEASVNRKKDDNLPVLLKSLPDGFQRKSGSQSGRAYNRMETEPGFDKLVNNISGLSDAIKPLIQWAEKQIPRKSHKATSLFLYATAGVRRLPSSDSEWLLNNAWSILKSSPFSCKKEWVKIITGVEEAYYGWIALNYHTGVLGSIPIKETYGALDLGGSSLQVTFEGKQGEYDETSLKLSIGPVNHHLSAYSLAGYGLNDAFDKSVAHLLKKHPNIGNADIISGKVEINHPCLQSGYKEQYACQHCSSIHQEDASARKAGVPIQLIGVPNWAECNALAKVAVNLSEWSNHSLGIDCELHPCALAENLPRPVGQFYAMSGFYVVYRFFNLTPDAILDDVLEKGDGRVKTPLSPTVAGTQKSPLDTGLGFGSGGIQFTESSLYSSSSSVPHSYSSDSLGQMQFDNSSLGSFWTPNRSQMRLQSRRSQSREDLNSSIAEAHLGKV